MTFRFHIPKPPLDEFIASFIYYEGVVQEHVVDRFLPNGDTEILIDFRDAPQYIYDNTTLKEIQACNHVWASGLRTEPITIPSGNGAEMMVITFKKGMSASFFPFPMAEIADSVVDADLIWGNSFSLLRERLLETTDIDMRFCLAERFLLDEFAAQMELNPCVSFAVTEMIERPNLINIAEMNLKIGYSQKHFTELFKRQVGVTSKSFLRIMRFQNVIKNIDSRVDLDWANLALESGFYDQAHFIHDFRHFSGFTPEVYAKVHTNYQNYIPVG